MLIVGLISNHNISQILFICHKSISIFNNMKFTTSNQFIIYGLRNHIDSFRLMTYGHTAWYKIDLIYWLIDWLVIGLPYQLTVSHISQKPPAFSSLAGPKSLTAVIRKISFCACFSRCERVDKFFSSVSILVTQLQCWVPVKPTHKYDLAR